MYFEVCLFLKKCNSTSCNVFAAVRVASFRLLWLTFVCPVRACVSWLLHCVCVFAARVHRYAEAIQQDPPGCLATLRRLLQAGPVTSVYSGGGNGMFIWKWGCSCSSLLDPYYCRLQYILFWYIHPVLLLMVYFGVIFHPEYRWWGVVCNLRP